MCTERKKGGEHFIISEEGRIWEVVREIEWWLILSTDLLVPINCTEATWTQFLNLSHWRWTEPETTLNWMQCHIPVKWGRMRDAEETDWDVEKVAWLNIDIPRKTKKDIRPLY